MFETLLGIAKVFMKPAEGIGEAMKKKKWAVALLVVFLCQILFFNLAYPSFKNELANRLSEDQLVFFEQMKAVVIILILIITSIKILFASFFVYLFYKIAETEGLFVNYFSGVAYASLITLIASGLTLVKKNLLGFANLSVFFPRMHPKSFTHIVLSQINVFTIWYLIALALGIAHFAKISPRKSLLVISTYFLFLLLTLSPLTYIVQKLFPF